MKDAKLKIFNLLVTCINYLHTKISKFIQGWILEILLYLTLVATALFSHVISWPQVALNLAAQVAIVAGPSTLSLLSR
jgi:hypothetical protein